MNFFEKRNVFFSNQFGFKENHSANQALLGVVTNCLDITINKLHSYLIMLDLRKAFENVNLENLDQNGIPGNANKLLLSYPTDRP